MMMTMMVDKEDLGLSLSLTLANNTSPTSNTVSTGPVPVPAVINTAASAGGNRNQSSPFPLNLLSAPHAFSPFISPLQKSTWNDSLPMSSSMDRDSETCRTAEGRSLLRGIDVNRLPVSGDDEDVGVSSPNSTISSVSGKRSERENNNAGCDDDAAERTSSRGGGGVGGSDDEDGDTSRKKLRLSKDQSAILEETFKDHNTLNPKQKLALAKRLGLRPRQVEVWFQNRRARTKLKQTEVDCEFLKRCCEQLTEENRRLQKEVQELRALKLSPQFYMQMTPPTTLTMCPSCERVGVPAASAPSSSVSAQLADSRAGNPVPSPAHRPVPVNPWVSAPVPIRPFEALHPRS
ncbi:hypothetical protein Dimus_008966 [Dionaea muscipula]